MKSFRAIPSALCLLLAFAAQSPFVGSQTTAPSAQTPSLQEFFTSVLQSPSPLPTWNDFQKVERPIPQARADDLLAALPIVVEALRNSNETIRRYAAAALVAISARPDSAQLLTRYIPEIGELLNAPEEYMQRGALIILAKLKPVHPPEIFPALFQFVKRTDRDPEVQVGALGILLYVRPEDPQVVHAVEEFTSRPLVRSTLVAALNSIKNSRAQDPRIAAVVIRSLDNPHPGVELAAIAALDRMGAEALTKAQPALTRLSKNENTDVAAAARNALARLGPQPH
jgi:HEAT repeat protein